MNKPIKLALLNLYAGTENQGMRCLRKIIHDYNTSNHAPILSEEFEVRNSKQFPGLNFDIYICSGGPGNPLEKSANEWEVDFYSWIDDLLAYNNNENNLRKKYVFFICHSFQMICAHLELGKVTKRRSTSFGVFPVHRIDQENKENIFEGLTDPFFAVDNRDYQVTEPNLERMALHGSLALAIEKDRAHVPYERAIMAMRINKYMIGTQFHPEADVEGMLIHFQSEEKKKMILENYGAEKYQSMIEQLNDPEKIRFTYNCILPQFIDLSVKALQHD
jgi:GMP synthase-like glutamine amidotransferase